MKIILPFLVVLNVLICNGGLLPWQEEIPMQEVVEDHEEETIQTIYKTDLKFSSFIIPEVHSKRYEMSYNAGQNCGKKGEAIYVNKVELPPVIILGQNATFALGLTVNREIKTASLLSVVLRKDGIGDIPCTDNFGTCNYTDPCDFLKKVKCPKLIIKLGWNCRCPILKKTFSLPPTTIAVPTVPLPAFLVNGKYFGKVQLFDGAEELLCYKIEVTVKEK